MHAAASSQPCGSKMPPRLLGWSEKEAAGGPGARWRSMMISNHQLAAETLISGQRRWARRRPPRRSRSNNEIVKPPTASSSKPPSSHAARCCGATLSDASDANRCGLLSSAGGPNRLFGSLSGAKGKIWLSKAREGPRTSRRVQYGVTRWPDNLGRCALVPAGRLMRKQNDKHASVLPINAEAASDYYLPPKVGCPLCRKPFPLLAPILCCFFLFLLLDFWRSVAISP